MANEVSGCVGCVLFVVGGIGTNSVENTSCIAEERSSD
jgi:hypothetical protein